MYSVQCTTAINLWSYLVRIQRRLCGISTILIYVYDFYYSFICIWFLLFLYMYMISIILYMYMISTILIYVWFLLFLYTVCPKKHGNLVTNSISSLLWISIVPNFRSHNIIMSARVYLMKRVNDCKDVSIMSLQDEQWRRTRLLCLYAAIFLFY